MSVIHHKLHSFWFYCLDTINPLTLPSLSKVWAGPKNNWCPTKLGNIFLPTKAGRTLVSIFEANKNQGWKIKNGRKTRKKEERGAFHKLTKAQRHQVLERFYFPPQLPNKVASTLQINTDVFRAPSSSAEVPLSDTGNKESSSTCSGEQHLPDFYITFLNSKSSSQHTCND